MEKIECAVIGAGVVGLACARALALAGREVIVLERADLIGTEDQFPQFRGHSRRYLLRPKIPTKRGSALKAVT